MTKRERVENILGFKYDYRYNEIDGTIQYKPNNQEKYRNHTDYDMNSIIRKIDKEGESISESMYCSIIKSDFTPKYHPIRWYFNEFLPEEYPDNKQGLIEALAKTVKVPNPSELFISLKRWLVASVANGLTPKGCQNHTCLVLTGGMGTFKTTWLANLCPPPLFPDMIMTGKIDLNLTNKDTFVMPAIKFIINLDDQLRNLMKRDGETMKTLITHPEISVRRPFSKFHETLPRIGNFIASINGDEFLGENENRRFLPFRIKNCDMEAARKIDMNEVWKEAFDLWKEGYKYHWDKEELEQAFPDMHSFAYATDELEALTTYFEIVEDRKNANVTMNATDITGYFKSRLGMVLSARKIGEALKTLGAIQTSVRVGKVTVKKYLLNQLDLTAPAAVANPMNPKKDLPF